MAPFNKYSQLLSESSIMGTVDTSMFRKKLKIMFENYPWIVIDNEFVKPGKGQAFNRTRMKNLITGRVLDKTFKSGETFQEADIVNVNMQFLYHDNTTYHFMNTKSFEQVEVPKDQIEEESRWLKENTVVEGSFWNGQVISITLPPFMDFVITYTEPAVRGDTANNVTKKATIDTGAEIDVPLFVNTNDKVRIDTRTGEYLQRAT